jgi:hypothetical protein
MYGWKVAGLPGRDELRRWPVKDEGGNNNVRIKNGSDPQRLTSWILEKVRVEELVYLAT